MKKSIEECKYTGITGMVYTPYVEGGRWYVIPGYPVSFLQFIYLCNIPDDEAVILKLKYGANIDHQVPIGG